MACNLLVVGHSHVTAIRTAAAARRAAGTGSLAVRTIHVLDPMFGGEFDPGADGSRLSPGLLAALRNQTHRHDPVVASALCGNMHTVLSLVEEDRPFDFA